MPNYRHERRKDKLLKLFARLGIRPSIRRGQNFLLDKNQVNFIARQGNVRPEDVVLEVGPGTGFLTQELLATGATVLAVELDRKLAELLREQFADWPNFFLIEADILANKTEVNPEVLARLEELLTLRGPDAELRAVSNLPYSAGTPFSVNLFRTSLPWKRAVFLLQLEVGQRMIAQPGSPDYGNLSIVCALGGKVKIERQVPPQVFWPRPRVSSAVISIDFNSPEERATIPWSTLRKITVAAFNARRKNLRNAFKPLYGKDQVDSVLEQAGLNPELRGQDLHPEQFLHLANLMIEDQGQETP